MPLIFRRIDFLSGGTTGGASCATAILVFEGSINHVPVDLTVRVPSFLLVEPVADKDLDGASASAVINAASKIADPYKS